LEKLANTYARDLFGDRKLAALAGGPRVYFNATNLATGNMFSFVAGGGKPPEMGDYELGFADAANFAISRAVAASSAFPPVFPPLRLGPDEYPPADKVEYVTLTDGGIYDNMGVNPTLRRNRNPLDYVIISDGGKPFAIDNEPTESGSIVLKAALDIMMEQIRGLEFDRIQHRHLAKLGAVPLWFSIDSREGETNPGDASSASSVSTNLKKLSNDEMTVLMRHGGALLAARVEKYAPELENLG
jgi:NTE family protein